MLITVAVDFSDVPDGRTPADSDFSGERFREELLIPKYKEAREKGEMLDIDFDGCYGCPPSFLEEAFGGAVRVHGMEDILDSITVIANEDYTIPVRIEKYVREAKEKRNKPTRRKGKK